MPASFNFRKIILVICTLAFVALFGLFVYRRLHRPKYVPLPPRPEINITIVPGWNLRQIAADWKSKGLIKSEDELYGLVGRPAYNYKAHNQLAPVLDLPPTSSLAMFLDFEKSKYLSYEGYFFPDTYRVYADATPVEIIKKIFNNFPKNMTTEMGVDIFAQGKHLDEILTMASVIEKEAPTPDSMGMVSDIFWRRVKAGWPLQSCATVNYITGKSDPAVTAKDRATDSLYNTYKYPGLPLGPISNPSLNAIKAAIYPIKNDYWYFMSGTDGVMHYAKSLDEHNRNVFKYLR